MKRAVGWARRKRACAPAIRRSAAARIPMAGPPTWPRQRTRRGARSRPTVSISRKAAPRAPSGLSRWSSIGSAPSASSAVRAAAARVAAPSSSGPVSVTMRRSNSCASSHPPRPMPEAYTALCYAGWRMLSRRALLITSTLAALARPLALVGPAAAAAFTVEDWSGATLGAHGVPPGWEKYETPHGHPAYDFTVVEEEGRRALALRSAGDHSTIAHAVHVDLAA